MSTWQPMGIDGDQRHLQLVGLGEVIEQIRGGGHFVGFLRYAQLRECQPSRTRSSCSIIRVMIALHQRIRATTESQPGRQHKISPKTPLT
jgi:hypothetical protein